ncbi:hypothetical protein AB0B45_30490 [Nonomuraea sp. NPDC049152]|uniref:hypothetical protein n=1 Tax=Nonomuraea sp. NPDC049152 TaxID=3154350 RepID=UPI0033F543D0
MLKRLAFGGALFAALAGVAFASPAQAETPRPNDSNTAKAHGNVIVCGNSAVGDIIAVVGALAPVSFVKQQPVDCSIRVLQNQGENQG